MILKYKKLKFFLNLKELTDATKTLDSNNTQNTHRSNDIENKVKQKMDDASREEILKALSVYADQIYANLGGLYIYIIC